MTNDNPKCECVRPIPEYVNDDTAYCYVCEKPFYLKPQKFKPLHSEPKCEHDGTDRWCDYKNNPASPFVALKEDCPECPICKPVEPNNCDKKHIDGLICWKCGTHNPVKFQVQPVEPSVEALEWIQKILPNTNEQIDHLLRERPFELYHILCVDIPDVIEKALVTHKLRKERNRK